MIVWCSIVKAVTEHWCVTLLFGCPPRASAAVAIALCFCVACFKIVLPFDVFSLRPSNKAFWFLLSPISIEKVLLIQIKPFGSGKIIWKINSILFNVASVVRVWCLFRRTQSAIIWTRPDGDLRSFYFKVNSKKRIIPMCNMNSSNFFFQCGLVRPIHAQQ